MRGCSSIPPKNQVITIAVGNISYLGTIGNWIKDRLQAKSIDCAFIEIPQENILSLLNEASSERRLNTDSIDSYDYSDDDVLNTLLDASEEDGGGANFGLDFDDSDEEELEQEVLDLSAEMLGNKIQHQYVGAMGTLN